MNDLLAGLALLLRPENIAAICGGTIIGYVVGIIPGLGASAGMALLIPFTFYMDPLTGVLLLVSLYGADHYGGAVPAITINTPGGPAEIVTTFDGYPMARQGLARRALWYALTASFVGGIFGTVVLIATAGPLASFALLFGPPEYFALGVFGLAVVARLGEADWLKATIAVLLGLFATTVGFDPISGSPRNTFGSVELLGGLPLIPMLIGLFAISEFLVSVATSESPETKLKENVLDRFPRIRELWSLRKVLAQSSFLGTLIGVIPGAGATIAGFVAYNEARRISKSPETFGKGNPEGLVASEASNNSVVGGSLVPLFALGLPGSAAAAVLVGALGIHGLVPGPLLFERSPDLMTGIFGGLLVGNVVMLIVGLMGIRMWTRIAYVRQSITMPVVLVLAITGTYALSQSLFDVMLALIFGVVGYVAKKLEFPLAPFVLALVLGELIETSFRQSMVLFDGNYVRILYSPVAAGVFLLTVAMLAGPSLVAMRRRNRRP
ncbi:MAG: tripartite tricarboxylate transporter permease [Afipia sp.]|nr:tripartite tricarboxylate transporter permease [Afipia sp.]